MERLLGLPMAVVTPAVIAIFLCGVAAMIVAALRNRLLARLALRNIPRRWAQSALISCGLGLATVIVATALNTGDTMSFTVRSLVAGTIGRTDEVIVQPRRDARRTGFDALQSFADGSFLTGTLTSFDQREYDRLEARLRDDPRVAGLAPALVDQVVAVNLTTNEMQAQVRLYGLPRDYPAVLGQLESFDGRAVSLADTPAGGLLLNVEAAAALQAWPGHDVQLSYRDRTLLLTVAQVVKNGELGGVQAIVLVPLAELQELTDQRGQINQILVANRGESATSVGLSEEVARAIRPMLVDDEAARRLHAVLRTDVARAELAAALPGLDDRTRFRVESLLRELDAEDPTDELKALISDPDLERRLFGLGARLAALQGRAGTNLLSTSSPLRVVEVKRLSQELADRWGGALTNVFLFLGLFSIATGVLLVVLIFSLLAAERRSEMGVVRALGGTRRQLVAMFLYEGLVYDLVGSAVGLAIGVAVAVALIQASADVLAGFGIVLRPTLEPSSLALAYCLGGAITMLSVLFGAWRASRLSVVAAIKDLPEPAARPRARTWIALTLLLLGAGIGLVTWGSQARIALAIGGGIALTVLGLVLAARMVLRSRGVATARADRIAYSCGGLALLGYWLAPPEAVRAVGLVPPPRSMDLFVLAGLSLVLGATWLIAFNLSWIVTTGRRLAGARGHALVTLQAGLAYPAAHRFRTGMAVAMFSLVIFTMVVASVLLTGTHRAYSDPQAMAGGFDIRVEQTIGGAPDLRATLPDVAGIKDGEIAALGAQRQAPAEAIQVAEGAQRWRGVGLHVLDEGFLDAVGSGFTARAAGYASDAAVWKTLRERTGLAVIAGQAVRPRGTDTRGSPSFRIEGVAQEDTRMTPLDIWVRDTRGGRAVKLQVIGVLDPRASFGAGLFTSEATFAASGAPQPGRVTYFARVGTDVSAAEKALALNLHLNDRGLRATEIGEEVRRIQSLRMLLNELLQGFIGVGLLAGIAGLGVISMRVVVERRKQIGIMRALGFSQRAVQSAFLIESAFVSLLGVGCGVLLGLGLAYRIVEHLGREFPEIIFNVPAGQIALISLGAFAATLAMTFIPARQAGHVNPAEALRWE